MSTTGVVTVACCQLAPKIGDLAYNRLLTERAIRSAAFEGAQIIVLPELVQSGYVFQDLGEALTMAETTEGDALSLWFLLAQELNVVIVAGFCEKLPGAKVANSCALIDATGVRAIYRKAHLWDAEKAIFTPGDDSPPVVETAFGRLSMLICYDLEFPEWVRMPALEGADLLCAPVNWPRGPRPTTERPTEIVRVQANASVNKMFIAACDRYGTERGVEWVQGSVIVDADGYPVTGPATDSGEAILLAQLNLSDARNKWISKHNELHSDRRPSSYNMDKTNTFKEQGKMSIYDAMQDELSELITLVRLDEQFISVLAHGALKLDRESSIQSMNRKRRIEEISNKFGIGMQPCHPATLPSPTGCTHQQRQ